MHAQPSPTAEGWLRAFALGDALPSDCWQACQAAIDTHNATINAIPTHVPAASLELAFAAADARIRSGKPVGALCGLPYVAKDIFATAGLRTTFGSPIYADHIPEQDAAIVARIKAAQAVLIGKSNTPEFAAGSQTFNPVLGATRNPHDLSRTVGGSSGGAAAALATGMALVADGSDLAASLRNPAAFCGVVGLRPSSYLDPSLQPDPNGFGTLNAVGPLGRTVTDCEIAWRAIFEQPVARPVGQWVDWLDGLVADTASVRTLRVAASVDLGGLPVEQAVRAAFGHSIDALRRAGVEVVDAHPDFAGADEAFQTLRALYFVEGLGELYATERVRMKDTVVWNVERGLELTVADIVRAQRLRTEVFHRVAAFMQQFDALLLPSAQVLPFPLDVPYPTHIDGAPLSTYIDWLKTCYWITVSAHPALSIPGGTAVPAEGAAPLPVGLQLVGRFRREAELFRVGRAIERVLG